jgi:hypothetical protein
VLGTDKFQTLSTPLCCSVGNPQDKKLYRSFVWNLLGAHPVSFFKNSKLYS